MRLFYKYNADGTYKETLLVESLDSILVKAEEVIEIVDGEEVVATIDVEPHLPDGVIDVRPTGVIVPNVSPKFDKETNEWVADEVALQAHFDAQEPVEKPKTTEEAIAELKADLASKDAQLTALADGMALLLTGGA